MIAVDVDAGSLAALAREPPAACGRLHVMIVDAGDAADVEQAVARMRGFTDRLDGLVRNAGILVRKPLEALSPST